MYITMRRPVVLFAIILALSTVLIPRAWAGETRWERIATEPSRFEALTSPAEPIAVCTGDTQFNFTYQPGLETATFESISTTVAGTAYGQQSTEVGWATGLSASDTGVAAAILDLWGSEAARGLAPEAFTLAMYELTEDARGLSESTNAAWRGDARVLLAKAKAIAGPHTADDLTMSDGNVAGFVIRGQEGAAIAGLPFTATLEGAVFTDTGTATLAGQTGSEASVFAVDAPAFGEVTISVTYTSIPGHSFRTGHHPVAQDMHLMGSLGELSQAVVLRDEPQAAGVEISTQAFIEIIDGQARVGDLVTVSGQSWPSAGDESATYQMTVDLYGPFAEAAEQSAEVPAGIEPIETLALQVEEPGEYRVVFDSDVAEGWYTVVVSGEFDTTGAFEGLPPERVVMPFFEPAESVYVEVAEPEPEPTPEPTAEPEPTPEAVPSPEPEPTRTPVPVPTDEPKVERVPTPAPAGIVELPNTGHRSAGGVLIALGLIGLGGALRAGSRAS